MTLDFDYFISDRLGNDLFINDPERAERIHEYAENGSSGSTHGEVIQDWRDYLDTLRIIDPDFDEHRSPRYVYISEQERDLISTEIDSCESWHIANGSIDQIIN